VGKYGLLIKKTTSNSLVHSSLSAVEYIRAQELDGVNFESEGISPKIAFDNSNQLGNRIQIERTSSLMAVTDFREKAGIIDARISCAFSRKSFGRQRIDFYLTRINHVQAMCVLIVCFLLVYI